MTRKEFLKKPLWKIAKYSIKAIWMAMVNDECFKHIEYINVMSEKQGNHNPNYNKNEKEEVQ